GLRKRIHVVQAGGGAGQRFRGDVSKRYRRQDDAGAASPGGETRARLASDYAAASVVTLCTAQNANCRFIIFNLIDQPSAVAGLSYFEISLNGSELTKTMATRLAHQTPMHSLMSALGQ